MKTRLVPNQIARRQHALITNEQALAAGLSQWQVRRRIRSGEWVVARPGVYAVGGAPPTWLQGVAAVALCAEPDAWISHHTAAAVWGMPIVDDDAIHIVTVLCDGSGSKEYAGTDRARCSVPMLALGMAFP